MNKIKIGINHVGINHEKNKDRDMPYKIRINNE